MNVRLTCAGLAFAAAAALALTLAAGLTAAASQGMSVTTVRYVAPAAACGGVTPCYGTIQAAVDAAAAGDEVRVAAGVYTGVSARAGMTQSIFLDKALTVAGGYTAGNWGTPNPDANVTVIDAQGLGRGLVISGTRPATAIRGLRITGGDAGDGYFGGGVYAISATVAFSNNWVYANVAGVGAGLYLEECPDALLTDNRIYDNNATDEGGGFAAWNSQQMVFQRNQIYRNTAGGFGGGGSLAASDDARLAANAFHHNTSEGDAGGLAIQAGMNVSLSDNQIYGNRAEGSGGGVAATGGIFTVARNQIYENNAGGPGGGLLLTAAIASQVAGNQVFANAAGECGGGLSLMAGAGILLADNRIYDNAAFDGGGLCLDFNDGVQLMNSEIYANRAAGNGGGAYVSDIAPALAGNRIYSNTAQAAGGGFYIMWTVDGADLTANQVYSNTAQAEGGGIAVVASDALVFTGNRIWGNMAGGAGGGGLYMVNSADSLLVNNVVHDNRISGVAPGAGLALDYTRNLRLLHTTLSNNHGGAGSAVYVTDGRGDGSPPESSAWLTNTILVSCTTGIHVTTGNQAALDGVLWYGVAVTVTKGATATVAVAHQFTGDPAFAADGYHLTRASAAIDRGVNAGVDGDIDGEPRPQSGGYDLGADEYAVRRVYLPLIRR